MNKSMTMRRRIRQMLLLAESTSGELASILGIPLKVASAQLSSMTKRGDVEGEWMDKRRKMYRLTDKGRSVRVYKYRETH